MIFSTRSMKALVSLRIAVKGLYERLINIEQR